MIRTRDGFGSRSCDGTVRCGGRESDARRRTSAQKRIFNSRVRRRTIVRQFYHFTRRAEIVPGSIDYGCILSIPLRSRPRRSFHHRDGWLITRANSGVSFLVQVRLFFLTIPFRSVRQARKHDTQRMCGLGRDTYVLARRCRCHQGCHFGQIHF